MDKTTKIQNNNELTKLQLYKKQWADKNRQKIVEAKRRFYEKMKNNPEFMENLRQKAKERYRKKKEIENISEDLNSNEIVKEKKRQIGRPRVYP
jgi:hypothetical protein